MFVAFYSLREDPFGPVDPRFIYLSANHRKALASLHYGIERSDGIQLLVGDAGLGKTTLLRHLQVRLRTNARVVMLAAADLKKSELLDYPASAQESGRADQAVPWAGVENHAPGNSANAATSRLILLIDDAHDLGDAELAGLLVPVTTCSSVPRHTHIILAGRPGLADRLRQPLAANSVREVVIEPMSTAETRKYINHRLRMAAGSQPELFTPAAYAMIADQSGGVPGMINTISAKALAAGAERCLEQIDSSIHDRNEPDVSHRFVMAPFDSDGPVLWSLPQRYNAAWTWLALVLVLVIAGPAALWYENNSHFHRTARADVQKPGLPESYSTVANRVPAPNSPTVASPVRSSLLSIAAPDHATAAPPVANSPAPAVALQSPLPAASSASPSGHVVNYVPHRPVPNTVPASVADLGRASHLPQGESYSYGASINPAPIADPHQAQIEAEVGDDYMRVGKYQRAIDFYQEAAAFAPNDEQIKEKLAQARIAALKQ
jgi:general secretion pathway protein A